MRVWDRDRMAPARPSPRPEVRFDAGTGYELLASIGAVAEDRWRSVLTGGERLGELARAERGPAWTRKVGSLGRFGWINLLSLLLQSPAPHTAERCLALLADSEPETFHLAALGMHRRQLRAMVSERQAIAAVRGDRAGRLALRQAAASDQTVLTINRWLLTTASSTVHGTAMALLEQWHETVRPGWQRDRLTSSLDREVRARRGEAKGTSAVEVIRTVTGGLVYAPGSSARRTVLAPAPSVHPAVIVVDDRACDLVVYPPGMSETASRDQLLLMSRALGDDTRLRLLAALREGQHTATALAGRLGTPRTTLIHHLALLRSAGLIRTEVLGNATYYTLRPDSPDALAAALRGFFDSTS